MNLIYYVLIMMVCMVFNVDIIMFSLLMLLLVAIICVNDFPSFVSIIFTLKVFVCGLCCKFFFLCFLIRLVCWLDYNARWKMSHCDHRILWQPFIMLYAVGNGAKLINIFFLRKTLDAFSLHFTMFYKNFLFIFVVTCVGRGIKRKEKLEEK